MPNNFVNFISTHPWVIALVALWVIPWKGVALWKATRNGNLVWFVILLIVNTLGILEIIYIFAFSGKNLPATEQLATPTEPEKKEEPEKVVPDIKKDETEKEIPKS